MRQLLYSSGLLLLLLIWAGFSSLNAQNQANIDLDVQAESILTNAQIIELANFAFDESGRGSRLVTFRMQNLGTEPWQYLQQQGRAQNLYLDFQIVSDRRGTIVEAYQREGRPFSLAAGQSVVASNNAVARGSITGISEPIRLDGDLTTQGENLINSLQGRTTLPVDEYEIIVRIYQDGNRFSGTLVAEASVVIGTNLVEGDLSIYLQAPGDVAGSDITISNSFPEFRWEGLPELTYRVVVVEEQPGETPETLIQSALSTSPARLGQSTSLLEFENADVLVDGTSFQYPTSGVQALREGRRYYWQVFSTLVTTSGEERFSSEIWSFKLDGGIARTTRTDAIELDDEVQQVLVALLGSAVFNELAGGDYQLESIDLDGVEFSGEMAREELIRLIEKIQEGKIKVRN